MKRVAIDARESGTSTGRYVDKLIEYLHGLKPSYEFVVLTKAARMEFMKTIAPSFEVVESNYKEFTFAEQIGFLKQLRSLKPDLVYFSMTQQPVLYRGKSVTTVHDLTTVRFNNPSKNWLIFKLKQQVYKWVIRRVAKKSEALITPSDWVKYDVAQFSNVDPAKITVTYEAADKITVPPTPIPKLQSTNYLLYVGRPQPHKNLGRLIDAFASLQVKYPDLRLVLAGKKDALYERYEKKVETRKIKNVIFTDFVSEGELRWLYENTAAYVFPSLSEGFGLPGLEAMVHGAPVVSSNATCLPEIYGDGARYFDPMNIEDMATKIAEVLDDKNLRAELISKGKTQATKYSWAKMASQTLEIYKETLENS